MKKVFLFLVFMAVAIMTSLVAPEAKAQKNSNENSQNDQNVSPGGDEKFFCSIGSQFAYNAPGKAINKGKPTFCIDLGYRIPMAEYVVVGIRMRPLTPYSPATIDSFKVVHWNTTDSTSWEEYSKFYNKTATLLGTVGVSTGEGFFSGGLNTGAGVAFVEKNNKLVTVPVWDFTIEGGVNILPRLSVNLNCTYAYLWHQGSLSRNGFAVLAGANIKLRF